ncbi:MAG: Gfo/Idh/MocA family oxidoreductase [Ignavibacteriales bacterium]|nr:Gfo/Idh/MocA family oxidoreductase [Ignavibacteriales bacterium]
MTDRKIGIGQAGIANHGRTIVNATRDSGNLQLVSCFDINAAANEKVALEFGASRKSNYDDLVNDPAIEAISLVTPNHLHPEEVEKAVKAGKHIFVEKPIGNTVAEARAMMKAVKGSGLVLMVGHNTRRRQVFRRAKALLEEKRIGEIVAIEANLSRPAGLQAGLPLWKADPKTCPLLPMIQLGIHFVDTIEYLIGRVARVSCFAANIAMPNQALDSTAAILQLESGIPVSLTSYYVSADAYFVRIYGTRGTIHCLPTKLRLELLEKGEFKEAIEEDFSSEGAGSYVLQMREFGECILQGKQPETGGEEGLRALAVVEAMVKSVENHAVVELKEIL